MKNKMKMVYNEAFEAFKKFTLSEIAPERQKQFIGILQRSFVASVSGNRKSLEAQLKFLNSNHTNDDVKEFVDSILPRVYAVMRKGG